MNHYNVGKFLALSLSLATVALAAYALTPSTIPTAQEPTPHVSPEPVVASPDLSVPVELPVVVITAERKGTAAGRLAATKTKKRVCDKRGHTFNVGYAVPTETRITNETGVTVCWTE